MAKVAFVFPGQGSQKVGMGLALAEASAAAKATFEEADQVLEAPLSELCFRGPEAELTLTENTQPAILACSVALLRALGEGVGGPEGPADLAADFAADFAAGHSLGEYSAHVAAGTLSFAQALRLTRLRGRFMQEAVPVGEGAMSALIKLSPAQVEELCAQVEAELRSEGGGVVSPANFNAPGQIVIAGSAGAVRLAGEKAAAIGGRAIPLPVSAPFHCALMKPAEERLERELASLAFEDPAIPVYTNVAAAPVTSAAAAKEALARQVSAPVRWTEVIEAMIRDGARLFVEIGHGSTLKGMIRRIDRGAQVACLSGPEDVAPVRAAIAAARAG